MKKLFSRLIILLLIVGIGYLFLNGKCWNNKYDANNKEEILENWMSYLDDEQLISNVVIPGSHDAGTYGMFYLAETQTYSIEQQLNSGYRYLDIRIREKKDKYVVYHSIFNGVDFIDVMADIKDFIINHDSEFLILDFQHFDNSQDKCVEIINEYLTGYLYINNTSLSDMEFIANTKVKDVRGKCIILFGDDSAYSSENYIYARNNDAGSKKKMSLDSYYNSSLQGKSSQDFINEALPYYLYLNKEKIKNEKVKALFVLQAQLTDTKLIFGPYSREKNHESNMSEYIVNLKDSEELENINIIMRDFVNENKAKEIIILNYYKDTISKDKLDSFKNILDIK